MIRSSLVKSACVAIALSGFSPPQASAIEMQGSNPTAQMSEGMISKVVVVHRGATAVGPRGGVYHRGGTYRGGVYRGGSITAGFIAAEATGTAGMAAGRGPAGIAGARAARSPPAQPSACLPPEPPSPTPASRRRPACAGTTPTRATGRGSGTPARRARRARRSRMAAWAAAIRDSDPPEAAVSCTRPIAISIVAAVAWTAGTIVSARAETINVYDDHGGSVAEFNYRIRPLGNCQPPRPEAPRSGLEGRFRAH